MTIPKQNRKYSYVDYLGWNEDERIEIIDGVIYNMTPAPSRKHQQVLRELATEFTLYLRNKECEVFFAPFDVRLLTDYRKENEVFNIVQPDLTIICDKNKLDNNGCNGTPDIIIEILSPASVKIDRWNKYKLYENAGVKEYWIVDPVNESIEMYILTDHQYKLFGIYNREDIIQVQSFKGFEISLSQIFKNV